MPHKFQRDVEIRSALIHLHKVVAQDAVGREGVRAAEAIDRLAIDLGSIYGESFDDLEAGDSYGEIEYLRWAIDGCQTLLDFSGDEEMEEAISIADSEDGELSTLTPLIEQRNP